jgi:16S rRNA (cytosine1402-N4)-methyltransferase
VKRRRVSSRRRGDGGAIRAPTEADEHVPVMLNETVELLAIRPNAGYIDGTVGLGGHAAAILERNRPGGRLLGIDADPDALAIAAERLAQFGDRVRLVRGNFRDLATHAQAEGFEPAAGVLLDLGVSSLQFGPRGRGFAFRWDQPLDMRMDPSLPTSAADIVNSYEEDDLANLIYEFGEERRSRAIARAIVRARPVETTVQLARTVEQAVGRAGDSSHVPSGREAGWRPNRWGKTHPATRTFQALRIGVNRELESLTAVVRTAHDLLEAPGGRLAVISYHSLEDRIVKEFIRRESRDCVCPPGLPICACGHRATLAPVTKGAVQPSPAEVATNPRSRSARLRVAVRL